MNLSFIPFLLTSIFLFGCAKAGSGTTRAQNQPVQQQDDANPKITSVPAVETLPTVSFVQSSVEMNRNLEAELELQLSEPAKKPVTVEVKLVDGSALHYRDFSGYKVASALGEVSFTLVFAPGTTTMKLPRIGGVNTFYCDTDFTAQINILTVQNALVTNGKNTAKISLPCSVMN